MSDDESDESDSDEDEDDKPDLEAAFLKHSGCVNRVRVFEDFSIVIVLSLIN